MNPHDILTEPSPEGSCPEGKGREGKGREGNYVGHPCRNPHQSATRPVENSAATGRTVPRRMDGRFAPVGGGLR